MHLLMGIYETMVKATKKALKSIKTWHNQQWQTAKRVPDDLPIMVLTPNQLLLGNMRGAVNHRSSDSTIEVENHQQIPRGVLENPQGTPLARTETS